MSASVHAGIPHPPQSRHPPDQTPPWEQTPPQEQTPPGADTPPGTEHAGRYGQRAGGTHPTGMQSCFLFFHNKYLFRTSIDKFKSTFSQKNHSDCECQYNVSDTAPHAVVLMERYKTVSPWSVSTFEYDLCRSPNQSLIANLLPIPFPLLYSFCTSSVPIFHL